MVEIKVLTLGKMDSFQWNRIVRARIQTFIVDCFRPYQEIDDKDERARHVIMTDEAGRLVGYARFWEADQSTITLDRMFIVKELRRQGLGMRLLSLTARAIRNLYPEKVIEVQAEDYLANFFDKQGFKQMSTDGQRVTLVRD